MIFGTMLLATSPQQMNPHPYRIANPAPNTSAVRRQGVHDEKGFVVGIAPCVWGAAADGLRPPPRVRLDGNYTSIKRVNSTHGHWGVMALWQMRGAYAD